MSDLSVNKNEEVNIKSFSLLAKYIRYQKLSQSNDNGLISKIDNIDASNIVESNKNSGSKNIIIENDKLNSPSNTIKSAINEIEKLDLNMLKTDPFLQKFELMEFLDSTSGQSLLVQVFHNIKNIEYQFALIEYALKNGQNPMSLFDINIYWIMKKIEKYRTVKLNGQEIKSQKRNDQNGLFYPEFYLKCELVFNLFCLYSGDNLFDLFSAEEIIRQFGGYAGQFVKFCYDKKCGNKKNDSNILSNQLEKEFEARGKRYGIVGGLFGFFVSLIFMVIIANIFAVFSPLILFIVVPGTFIGYAGGKIKKSNKYIEVLDLFDLKNIKNNVLLMQQTFKVFKDKYTSSEPISTVGPGISESNNRPSKKNNVYPEFDA